MTEYTRAPLTEAALDAFWPLLWERGKEEIRRYGLTDAEARAFALNNSGEILYADGVPVCIAGFAPDGENEATWFQATEQFQRHAKAITRLLRGELAKRSNVRVYSALCHPDTVRWFALMGLELDGWIGKTKAGATLYRFSKRTRPCALAAAAEART